MMKQILQSLGSGETLLEEVPVARASGPNLVVGSRASLVSAGTERMLVDFGRGSLLHKARQQPDKVRQVLDKVRTDGLAPTLEAVRSKLDQPIPLGYCQAGVVLEAGPAARGFAPGDRVVTNGPHAEVVRVPWTLAARIPEGVPFDVAAFTPLAAIGLQGLRLAAPTLGETVVVYGLGLIGLLTVQLARASGCRVIGIDRVPERLALARRFGAETVDGSGEVDVVRAVEHLTGGVGTDMVLLTLATDSDEPIHAAAGMCRKRGRIVLVGVTGLGLVRDDFYRKELTFQVSCSYGPGRYDPVHEEGGVDYPLPFVRWTEARNFEAVLALMASGQLDPRPLVTHRFPFGRAVEAYDVVTGAEPGLGIVLEYPHREPEVAAGERTVTLTPPPPAPAKGVLGCIGAGNFAARVLIPSFASAGATLHTVASSGGTSAAIMGRRQGFRQVTTDVDALLENPAIDTVVIATRHDTHGGLVVRALQAGKHVYVEKPLALRDMEIDAIEKAVASSGRHLCVGFNRRFAPTTQEARRLLAGRSGPLVATLTVNAGALPLDHWAHDPQVGGGRLVGEGCHFLDLARYLVGAPIQDVRVMAARAGADPVEDVSLVQVAFADGSIASIQYLANGNKGFPKERVELFWEGKVARIDNFRSIEGWGVSPRNPGLIRSQDKGHDAMAEAFLAAVRGEGPPPIPGDEILEVARWVLRLGEGAQAAGGSS
jgi:predicted dehydrogenase/threonine dehydrogenase-like Zn-dependent dehydrogenase